MRPKFYTLPPIPWPYVLYCDRRDGRSDLSNISIINRIMRTMNMTMASNIHTSTE